MIRQVVIARNPNWNHIILVHKMLPESSVLISTSNGGFVNLSYELVRDKIDDGIGAEIEQPV